MNQGDMQRRAEMVIEGVAEGAVLRAALECAGMTGYAFNKIVRGNSALGAAYALAQEMRADLYAGEIVSLADGDGDPAKVRNQIGARQWVASKQAHRRYGDRVEVSMTETVSLLAAVSAGRARMLPPGDPSLIEDVQVIEMKGKRSRESTDTLSVAQLLRLPADAPEAPPSAAPGDRPASLLAVAGGGPTADGGAAGGGHPGIGEAQFHPGHG